MGDKKVSVNGIKNWFHDTKKKVTDTAKSAANWVAENPVTTAIIVGCVSSMAQKAIKHTRSTMRTFAVNGASTTTGKADTAGQDVISSIMSWTRLRPAITTEKATITS